MGRPALALAALAALTAAAAGIPPAAGSVASTGPTAAELALAVSDSSPYVTGAAFEALSSGDAVAIGEGAPPSAGFPRSGATFGILTTGDAADVDRPNQEDDLSTSHGGPTYRGAYDAVVLRVDFVVPEGGDCLQLSYRFLSEEYPDYYNKPDNRFNDAFIAELDQSTWTLGGGGDVIAPDNFAFTAGSPVNINTVPMTAGDAAGTTYGGGSPVGTALQAVTAGAHSVYLTLIDVGDDRYDSAVFLDSMEVGRLSGGADPCVPVDLPELLYDYTPHGADSCQEVTFFVVSAPKETDAYYWEFGDGNESFAESPTHLYTVPGVYTTSLRITVDGEYMDTQLAIDVRNCLPTALFTLAPFQGSNRVAEVADMSFDPDSGCIAEWHWDFGGEGYSLQRDPPPFRFTRLGRHVVSLDVVDCMGGASNVYRLEFLASNALPWIDPVPPIAVARGEAVSFDVVARDLDQDAVSLTMLSGPFGSQFPGALGDLGEATAPFTLDTGPLLPGAYKAVFVADESNGERAVREVHIEVRTPRPDADSDGVADNADTCPGYANRGQDGSCEAPPEPAGPEPAPASEASAPVAPPDADRDGVPDRADNCPADANHLQADLDGDGAGDACDGDVDGDGVAQAVAKPGAVADNCPGAGNADQADADRDGVGDACDLTATRSVQCGGDACKGRAEPVERLTRGEVHGRRAYLLAAGVIAGTLAVWAVAEATRRRSGHG